MSAELAASMKATVEAFIMSFDGKWTVEKAMKLRAPGCIHEMLPVSVGVPAKTNDEWAERFALVSQVVTEAKMTMHEYVGAPGELRAAARSTSVSPTPVGEYTNEYSWFFSFTEDGKQLVRIVEFVDSHAVETFRVKLVQAGIIPDESL